LHTQPLPALQRRARLGEDGRVPQHRTPRTPAEPVVDGDAEAVLDGLDPQQRAVATALRGPVCVLAGAGTGKTRALTHRIAYGVQTGTYDPGSVLAVAFTTRAAAEMRVRLSRLGVRGVATRTFHSAALAQVRHFWPRLYGTSFPSVLDDPAPLLRDLVAEAGVRCDERDLAVEISWAKVSNVDPEQYPDLAAAHGRRLPGATPDQVAALYAGYMRALARAERVDLEDVLLAAVGVLRSQPSAAAVVRRRFRWFVVDEFQDVSGAQLALLEAWLGDRDELCVVGDPAQAIYGFAGARPEYLAGFADRFPGAQVLELTHNYRSTPQILRTAAALGAAGGPALDATRTPDGPVVLVEAADDQREVAQTAEQVRALLDAGAAQSDVAVLVRTRSQVAAVSRALRGRGIGVSARGGARFFERPEVRQAMALLAAARRHEGDTAGGSAAAAAEAVLLDAGWLPARPEAPREAARWESWAALVAAARDLDAGADSAGEPPPTLSDLVDNLREMARAGEEPRGVGVTVATLHATKGQEWSQVFVLGVHEGGIPNNAATSRVALPQAVAEERRLLYVGMTRARDRLTVSWSARRSPDQARRRPPSRFLQPTLASPTSDVEIRLQPSSAGR
jgi:DNA helicase II / ATP-dependent DNA helicase PcrA